MDNMLTLSLAADNATRNHHRHYAITVGRDLLDFWTVSISYGRSGQKGRVLRYADADPEAMVAVIRNRIHRRLSAPKRIGCSYRLVELSSATDFNVEEWLPRTVLDGCFKGQGEGVISS